MARILYSVCGIGFGHAMRSTSILEQLVQHHEVVIVSHGKAFAHLTKKFSNVKPIQGFHLEYQGGSYDKSETLVKNARELPELLYKNMVAFSKIIRSFKPQVIITDFEPTAVYAGTLFQIPVITVTNMHLMNFIPPTLNVKDKLNYYLTEKTVMKAFGPSKYYLIACLQKPEHVTKKKALCFDPIVRTPILTAQPEFQDNVLVYVEDRFLPELIPLLSAFSHEHFTVYANHARKPLSTIQFRAFSEKTFIQDLIHCKAVICHGGISLLSEAIVLGKPCYVFSDKNFFERYYNGFLIERQGFGLLEEKPTRRGLELFFLQLPRFQENLAQRKPKPGNKELAEKLESIIQEIAKKSNYKLF